MKDMGTPPYRRINHEGHEGHEERISIDSCARGWGGVGWGFLQALRVLHGEEPLRFGRMFKSRNAVDTPSLSASCKQYCETGQTRRALAANCSLLTLRASSDASSASGTPGRGLRDSRKSRFLRIRVRLCFLRIRVCVPRTSETERGRLGEESRESQTNAGCSLTESGNS